MRVSVCVVLFTFTIFLNSVHSTGRLFLDRHDRPYTEDERTKIVYDARTEPANQGLILFDHEGNTYRINRHGEAATYESIGLILWDDHDNHYTVNCQDKKVYDSEHRLARIGITLYDCQGSLFLVDYNREINFLKEGRRKYPGISSGQVNVEEIELRRQTLPRTSPEPESGKEIEQNLQAFGKFYETLLTMEKKF